MDPLVASKDPLNAASVEKRQTVVENGLSPENTRNLVDKEVSWADRVDEEGFKEIPWLPKNDMSEFAEKYGLDSSWEERKKFFSKKNKKSN